MSVVAESSYLGAYWGGRGESPAECGERLSGCLGALSRIDPGLSEWFLRAGSKRAASQPVAQDPDALAELFWKGRNRADFGGGALEHLGFAVGMWSRATPAVGLSVTAGGISDHPGVMNSFLLNFPAASADTASLYSPSSADKIMATVVEAWRPDYAVWTTHSLRDSQPRSVRMPTVGWITYIADAPVALPRYPRLADGVLIHAAESFGDTDTSAIQAVRRELQDASSLRPVPLTSPR